MVHETQPRSAGWSRRKLLRTGAVGSLALGALRPRRARAEDITLRFASLYPPTHPASQTADKFAELVEAKTSGAVKVDVFHNASLGGEREAAEGVRMGSIDAAYSGLTGFGSYAPEFGVLEMPYLYKDLDQVKAVVDTIGDRLGERMSQQGIKLLGYLYDGPRVTISGRPINSIDDMRGLKMRVPQIPLYIDMVQAFGATPTPVALPEIYTALQSRIVEALEGTPSSLYSQKFYEVVKNLARTDHIYFVAYIAMNQDLFDGFSDDVKAQVVAAGQEASSFNLSIAKPGVQQDFDRLTAAGVVTTKPDLAPFRAAVVDLKEKYAASFGQAGTDLYQAIKQVTQA
jgi:tripartite ATP-independent transporter DctP family solute receptor